ncbi:hypothetical protein AYO46_03055 [Betaproteobacteria bacterium SCGC AG-212-J23]|nr:hypothetical protein AYO46_03055 [Betaproteobacteria bacterium SCGC AG-212-J23]
MLITDLEAARTHHSALKLIIARHVGSNADLRALRRVVDLCRGLGEVLDDEYCREKVRVVAEYAAEMLAHSEHHRWGVDFLKRQIGDALELIDSRLYSLDLIRRVPARGAVLHFR